MLQINSIGYHVGGRAIFDNASGRVPAGQKVGLVGANGSGKTTLLRLVTGDLELDGGTIDTRKKCTVGTVSQDAPSGKKSPLDTVLESDVEMTKLLNEADQTTSPDRVAYVHQRLADIDAHSAPARAAVILAGLGFSEQDQARSLDEFSGGWRMRVALACALFVQPDLLLLDEPTNHLDLESIMWLETYLRQYPGTLLVVSHDRDLLNTVVDNILLVKDGKLTFFSGNYDSFVRAQAEREALEEATNAKQEAARAHLQSFVDRFKAKASKAKQAQSRIKALEKMSQATDVSRSAGVVFKFPRPENKPSPLVKLDNVSVGYEPGVPILSKLHLSIFSDDRIALLGANGNGKSTLARLLTGNLGAQEGHLVTAGKLVIGYFAQDHLEQLDPHITALEQVARHMPDSNGQQLRSWLGRFGLGQERSEVIVGNLSGGEKTRLALSLVALARPNLMILDEPTNHLDVDSRAALMDGLNNYEGAIVLISHDRQLIETTCDQLWLVKDHTSQQYFGDMDEYRKLLLSERSKSGQSQDEQGARASRKDSRREAAMGRAMVAPIKKRVARWEQALEKATDEKQVIEQELSNPASYEGPQEIVIEKTSRLKQLEGIIENAEEEWLAALEELEEAQNG